MEIAVVAHTEAKVKLLARRLRAKERGPLGMLMVGNVGGNRVRVDCLDFADSRSIRKMVFQSPDGFKATRKKVFSPPVTAKRERPCM